MLPANSTITVPFKHLEQGQGKCAKEDSLRRDIWKRLKCSHRMSEAKLPSKESFVLVLPLGSRVELPARLAKGVRACVRRKESDNKHS